jgi:hypothetical protein
MKDLPTESLELYDQEEEEIPTSMELALREAMEEQGVELPTERDTRRSSRRRRRRGDRVQDDIIARTLRTHND